MARVAFVFAHQDDEMACVSRIRDSVAAGDAVTCVYLTDGAARVPAAVRDAESERVLRSLGVGDVRFPGSPIRIGDGTLPEHLDRAHAMLAESIHDAERLVTLAWEGGHQDHDAAFVVAAVFAHERAIACTEMPLYNGGGTRGPLFRVNRPLGEGWTARPIPSVRRVRDALLCRHYASQRSTWMGLLPLTLASPAREFTRPADFRRALERPHPGPLLYERRFHYPYERLEREVRAFLRSRSLLR